MCYELSGELQSRMDTDAIPCDNFYQYACGDYTNKTVLTENQPMMNLLGESLWLSNLNPPIYIIDIESDYIIGKPLYDLI